MKAGGCSRLMLVEFGENETTEYTNEFVRNFLLAYAS